MLQWFTFLILTTQPFSKHTELRSGGLLSQTGCSQKGAYSLRRYRSSLITASKKSFGSTFPQRKFGYSISTSLWTNITDWLAVV